MCDEHFEEDLGNYTRFPPLTRCQFAAVSVGAGVAVMLPRAADALQVAESDVTVKTPDGAADCYFAHPAGGTAAGVYAGAAHGWCPPDSAVYNEKQAERAWTRLLALFKAGLG